jgi:uncharacterized protein (TIGR04222 family)
MMNQAEIELWEKIRNFTFDEPGSLLQFSQRLARENRWSRQYALAVLEEYRRFLFLACVAGHPVTPSIDVDEAWHLHMIYSQSYWNELCGKTLAKSLHHGPTKGGEKEALKYDRQYDQTLASYEYYFGQKPPASIWPEAAVRFRRDYQAVRVDVSRHWVIKKPKRVIEFNHYLKSIDLKSINQISNRFGRTAWPVVMIFFICLLAIGCAEAFDENNVKAAAILNPITNYDAKTFLIVYPIFAILLLFATNQIQRVLLGDERLEEYNPDPNHNDMVALLQEKLGEKNRLVFLSLSRLIGDKKITTNVFQSTEGKAKSIRSYKTIIDVRKPTNPVDKFLFELIKKAESENTAITDKELITAVKNSQEVADLENNINDRQLMKLPDQYFITRAVGFVLFLLFLGVGLWRMGVGLQRERPIGFLVVETIFFSIAFYFLNCKSRFLNFYTVAGRSMAALRMEFEKNGEEFKSDLPTQNDRYWQGVALLGLAAVPANDIFLDLITRYRLPDTSSGSSCGSSDGGSSCGGGCGGCGGGGD